MRRSSWISSISALALLCAGGLLFAACGRQVEGERCDLKNGNNDCEPPLICKGVVCCPKDDKEATSADCKAAPSTTDAAIPETAVTDTGAESSTETAAPDGAVDTTVVDTAVPDTAVPDTAVPDTSAPDTAAPDTAETGG